MTRKQAFAWVFAAVFTLAPLPSALASAELMLQGTLYSVTSDDFVIASGKKLYWIRKEKLNAAEQGMLERNPRGNITVHVSMRAIDHIRPRPQAAGAAARR